jgi:hypothetical protein
MSNTNTPNSTPIEYMRGQGAFFPAQPTVAQNTQSSNSATSAIQVATVQTTAPTSPMTGQLWFNQSSGQLYVYNGAQWQPAA